MCLKTAIDPFGNNFFGRKAYVYGVDTVQVSTLFIGNATCFALRLLEKAGENLLSTA